MRINKKGNNRLNYIQTKNPIHKIHPVTPRVENNDVNTDTIIDIETNTSSSSSFIDDLNYFLHSNKNEIFYVGVYIIFSIALLCV